MSFVRKPPYLNDRAIEKAILIQCKGLDTSSCMGQGVLVDDKYWLDADDFSIQDAFFLVPVDPTDNIPYSIANFYADCLAFEYEVPTVAFPSTKNLATNDIPWLFKPSIKRSESHTSTNQEDYLDTLFRSMEIAHEMNTGPGIRPIFEFDWRQTTNIQRQKFNGHDVYKLSLTYKYSNISTALHLYNSALKQTDPLSRYLCHYRIIENVAKSNGKNWIETKLNNNDLEYLLEIWHEVDFPRYSKMPEEWQNELAPEVIPWIRESRLFNNQRDNKINFTEYLRASALFALNELQSNRLSNKDIAERLYKENRCGIAHGTTIKQFDLADDFFALVNDARLLKYLARLAIEQHITV